MGGGRWEDEDEEFDSKACYVGDNPRSVDSDDESDGGFNSGQTMVSLFWSRSCRTIVSRYNDITCYLMSRA